MSTTWAELEAKVKACRKCTLASTCTQKVFGRGARDARVLVAGEAPRAQDDLYADPFHDRIGVFLRRQLANAGFVKGEVYLANVMKCRPPKNREPHAAEIRACVGHLMDQIELVRPKVVIALGQVAFKALVPGAKHKVGSARGDWFAVHGYHVVPTWNPGYALGSQSYLRVKELQKDLRRIHEKVFPPESLVSRLI